MSLSVLFGVGDGTFSKVATYPAGKKPSSVAIGDINGDGWLDVVTANYDSNNFGVLLSGGNVCAAL